MKGDGGMPLLRGGYTTQNLRGWSDISEKQSNQGGQSLREHWGNLNWDWGGEGVSLGKKKGQNRGGKKLVKTSPQGKRKRGKKTPQSCLKKGVKDLGPQEVKIWADLPNR